MGEGKWCPLGGLRDLEKKEKKENKKMGKKRICGNYCACVEENAETCERVILVVSEVTRANINDIALDSNLKKGLLMDKEDVLELEAGLEDEFEIEIPYGSLWGNISVRDVVREVLNCIAEKKEKKDE